MGKGTYHETNTNSYWAVLYLKNVLRYGGSCQSIYYCCYSLFLIRVEQSSKSFYNVFYIYSYFSLVIYYSLYETLVTIYIPSIVFHHSPRAIPTPLLIANYTIRSVLISLLNHLILFILVFHFPLLYFKCIFLIFLNPLPIQKQFLIPSGNRL